MTPSSAVPEPGAVVWVSFDPQVGREQAGRRPALVLSPAIYNRRSGLALVCPITNQAKGYPYEVAIPQGSPVTGVVLADQLKSVDWRGRNATTTGFLPARTVAEVLRRIDQLLPRPQP